MTSITSEQREALLAALDALLDKRRDSLTERAKRGYGDQWLTLHYFLEATTIEDAPTPDASPLWRDCGCDDRIKDGEIHLELVADPDMAVSINPAWIARGTSVLIGDDDEMAAILPEHLPALIAMLTEVQRRIGGEAK